MGQTGAVLIDLHCHSTASDGTDTPAELVRAGAAAGLDVMAITDHDTTSGWAEAASALGAGMTLVRGAELSCAAVGESGLEVTVHLLAHLFDPAHPELDTELTRLRGERVRRLRVMAERMAADGLPVDVQAVLTSAGDTLGRPHLGQALIAAGYVKTMDEAFAGVLSRRGGYYEDKRDTPLLEAVRLVTAAGGVSTLAHCRAATRGGVLAESAIVELAAAGLTGLEVDHADHTPVDRARLRVLAAELGLVPTGSSDYHGTNKTLRLAENTTTQESYEQLVSGATGASLLHGRQGAGPPGDGSPGEGPRGDGPRPT